MILLIRPSLVYQFTFSEQTSHACEDRNPVRKK